jgi:4a-hydroxytetrahydrobiopterin dehydratase
MSTLNTRQIKNRLKTVPAWAQRRRTIRRQYTFQGFLPAIDFVNRVARKAEKNDHHPDIDIRWNKVTLTLSTHSEGGLTGKDFSVARLCDGIYSRFFEP